MQNLSVSGAGFSTTFVPVTLSPNQSHEFTVRFSPGAEGSYSATLTINTTTALIRANALPAPSILIGGTPIPSMQVDVAAGQTLTIPLEIGNPYSVPLAIDELSVVGSGFTLSAPTLPFTLAPGAALPIPVTLTAGAEGEVPAVLTAGPRRFNIVASIFRPQLSPPKIVPGDAAPHNGQQWKIRLQLAEPALGPGTGTLRATFTGTNEDPAIVFANGAREIKFDIAAGSRDATFNGSSETVLQTGTTAGTLRLDAITETGTTTETYRFEPGPVVVDEATARRNGSTLEVDILGFDNTRGAGSLNFRFFDRSGNALGGVITTTPADQFKAFFEQSTLGGVFRLRAAFPVTGDATIVGSVLVEIANAVGRTGLQRLTIP
ncbi:MAG: hypothetical protein HYX27_06550 [Acidobacteria bacterium]|nr:hypothetical protein [Acidobacteriota bacterium]